MKRDSARDYLVPALNRLKGDIFNEDPDTPICLHRADIRRSKGPFERLNDDDRREDFNRRVLRTMRDASYSAITVLLDKQWLVEQDHWTETHPYHYLASLLVEKYTKFLIRMEDVGDIMPEARGKPQDRALQAEFERVRQDGTRYESAENICSRITSKHLKFRSKKDCVTGLQLCDMLAHPSHYTTRRDMLGATVHLGDFGGQVSDILLSAKYDRSYSGNVRGYGMKAIP